MLHNGGGWPAYAIVVGAVALAGWGIVRWARSGSFDDGFGYLLFGLVLGGAAAALAATRVVFEVEGATVRGYRRRFGRREPMFEHPLASVRDVGATIASDNEGDACFVTLILEDGTRQQIPQRFFLIVFSLDDELIAFRTWFLAQRYGDRVPAELPSDPPSFDA